MKKLFEVYKKEQRLPYVILFFIFAQATMILLSLIGIGYGGIGVILLAAGGKGAMSLGYALSIITNILILIFSIWAIAAAIKHDRKLAKSQKDEREMLHDQIVAQKGYTISIVGIVAYLIVTGDPLIILLLLAILTARFTTRMKLEGDN